MCLSPHLHRKETGRNNTMVPGFLRLTVSEGAIPAVLKSLDPISLGLWICEEEEEVKVVNCFCTLGMAMSTTLIPGDVCEHHTNGEN